ncbi:integrase [Sulfurifustis variabilis]|uniref:Integrase n=1 Tax=Sulfurifustis variabilis TaxID=1675686 RepID=A0A1C7AF34_9GAMM|nr:integrase [Sulfurifustis variabilis]
MLCKFKGSPHWYVRFTAPNGRRICRTTRTADRKLAQEYEIQLKQEVWRACQLGEESPKRWEEAVMPWSQAKKSKPSWRDLRRNLRILNPYLGGKLLRDITAEDIDRIKADRESAGVAPATTNRTLEVLRSVLRMALKRNWLKALPPIEFLDEPDVRIRWITPEEADRLIQELAKSKRTAALAELVRFSLATGLRESNVTGLEWSRVDLERRVMWVEGYQSKNGSAFNLPLSAEAILVLRRQQGKHSRWVFTYYGKRVKRGNTKAFKAALKRAGISNFRWHDLRHTWASWHVQNGTPIPVLQQLGGWKTLAMVMRYAHLGASHLAEFADNVPRLRVVAGKKLAKSECDSTEDAVSA